MAYFVFIALVMCTNKIFVAPRNCPTDQLSALEISALEISALEISALEISALAYTNTTGEYYRNKCPFEAILLQVHQTLFAIIVG
jgi:hypothetical protein